MNIGGLSVFCLGLLGGSVAYGLSFEIGSTYKRSMYGSTVEEGASVSVMPSGLPAGYELENAFGDVTAGPSSIGREYSFDNWKEESREGWKLRSVYFPGETKNASIVYDDFEVSLLGLTVLKRSATAFTGLLWGDLFSGPITLQIGYYTDTEFVNNLTILASGTKEVEVNIPTSYNAAWIHVSRWLPNFLNPYELVGEDGKSLGLLAEKGLYWQLGSVSWDQEGWSNEPVTPNRVPEAASTGALLGSVFLVFAALRRFCCRF